MAWISRRKPWRKLYPAGVRRYLADTPGTGACRVRGRSVRYLSRYRPRHLDRGRQVLNCLRQPSYGPCRWGPVLCWRKQRQGAMPCMKLENDGDATGRQTHCIQVGSPPPRPNFVQQTVLHRGQGKTTACISDFGGCFTTSSSRLACLVPSCCHQSTSRLFRKRLFVS